MVAVGRPASRRMNARLEGVPPRSLPSRTGMTKPLIGSRRGLVVGRLLAWLLAGEQAFAILGAAALDGGADGEDAGAVAPARRAAVVYGLAGGIVGVGAHEVALGAARRDAGFAQHVVGGAEAFAVGQTQVDAERQRAAFRTDLVARHGLTPI